MATTTETTTQEKVQQDVQEELVLSIFWKDIPLHVFVEECAGVGEKSKQTEDILSQYEERVNAWFWDRWEWFVQNLSTLFSDIIIEFCTNIKPHISTQQYKSLCSSQELYDFIRHLMCYEDTSPQQIIEKFVNAFICINNKAEFRWLNDSLYEWIKKWPGNCKWINRVNKYIDKANNIVNNDMQDIRRSLFEVAQIRSPISPTNIQAFVLHFWWWQNDLFRLAMSKKLRSIMEKHKELTDIIIAAYQKCHNDDDWNAIAQLHTAVNDMYSHFEDAISVWIFSSTPLDMIADVLPLYVEYMNNGSNYVLLRSNVSWDVLWGDMFCRFPTEEYLDVMLKHMPEWQNKLQYENLYRHKIALANKLIEINDNIKEEGGYVYVKIKPRDEIHDNLKGGIFHQPAWDINVSWSMLPKWESQIARIIEMYRWAAWLTDNITLSHWEYMYGYTDGDGEDGWLNIAWSMIEDIFLISKEEHDNMVLDSMVKTWIINATESTKVEMSAALEAYREALLEATRRQRVILKHREDMNNDKLIGIVRDNIKNGIQIIENHPLTATKVKINDTSLTVYTCPIPVAWAEREYEGEWDISGCRTDNIMLAPLAITFPMDGVARWREVFQNPTPHTSTAGNFCYGASISRIVKLWMATMDIGMIYTYIMELVTSYYDEYPYVSAPKYLNFYSLDSRESELYRLMLCHITKRKGGIKSWSIENLMLTDDEINAYINSSKKDKIETAKHIYKERDSDLEFLV